MSECHRKMLEQEVTRCHGYVIWPREQSVLSQSDTENDDGKDLTNISAPDSLEPFVLKVGCKVDLKKASVKRKLRHWQINCPRHVEKFFSQFDSSRKIHVALEVQFFSSNFAC